MNNKEKRTLIHQKLEIMKKCYREKDPGNFDLFYDTFFDRDRRPIIIGTDNGPWFRSMGRIQWLFNYDWERWGDLEIDTWNFRIHESADYDLVRARAVLDFGVERVWDVDIPMIFSKEGKKYPCRLMQFKIPRNEIRPVVDLNGNEEEQKKSEEEMKDLLALNGGADPMREHLAESAASMLREERPYLDSIDIRREMVYMEEGEESYMFALTGFAIHREKKALVPFRMVGIGQGYGIVDAEFSHPFVTELG